MNAFSSDRTFKSLVSPLAAKKLSSPLSRLRIYTSLQLRRGRIYARAKGSAKVFPPPRSVSSPVRSAGEGDREAVEGAGGQD